MAVAIVRFARLLRRERPDVAISWIPRVHTVLAPAALLSRDTRRLVTCEFAVPTGSLLERVVAALPSAWVLSICSRASLEANRALWPHRDGNVVLPGIEEPRRASAERLSELRDELSLAPGRPVVGIVGRLLSWKAQDRLMEAVALLRDRGLEVTLLIVGSETHGVEAGIEARLRDLVDRLEIGDCVRFCGHVPEPWAHVELMDVLVNASDGEPFGLVLVEAMALGVPVLAIDRFGPTEIIEHGESGWLVPTNRPRDLAEGLEALLRDDALRRRLAVGGRRRYEERFTAPRMAREVGRVLRNVAAEAPRRDR